MELPAQEMKFGKSLSLADRLGARFAVILGEDEMAAGQFTVKRLADGDQKKLTEAELLGIRWNRIRWSGVMAGMTTLDLLGDWKRTQYAAICARRTRTKTWC